MGPRPKVKRIRGALERIVLDRLLGASAWVIERRLFAATAKTGHDEHDRGVTMRL